MEEYLNALAKKYKGEQRKEKKPMINSLVLLLVFGLVYHVHEEQHKRADMLNKVLYEMIIS